MNTKEFLCTLPNGRNIHCGDKVYRTELRKEVTASSMYIDHEGDEYLCFEGGGNALVKAVTPFSQGQEIKLR